MAQSPELAGGAGFTFEDRVAATYLASLLQEGFAPGVTERTVRRVALQQRDYGEPLDDIIVDFTNDQGELARLSLQVKRSLTISAAPTNTTFQEVVRDCWSTFRKRDFRFGVDRYGAAVDEVATEKARDLQFLCELARVSPTVADFDARFAPSGNASAAVRGIKDNIASLIEKATGDVCVAENLHAFLAHLVFATFDYLHEGQTDLAATLNGLRPCLATAEASEAIALWDRLCSLTREGAGRSAVFDRPNLVKSLSANFRLAAAPSLRQDLEHLKRLAKQWLADIEHDVGGTHLERPRIAAKLQDKFESNRWVQIRGLPGSGKSVLLRQRVESELARGAVLFLKSGRLEGTGWASFATANGLSNVNLPDLLVELGATGSSTLYIDGIDRIEKPHQPIILDLVRTIVDDPLLDSWRIVVSLRDSGIEPLRNWLGNAMSRIGIGTVEVEALDDDDAKVLAKDKPHLRPLLFGPKQVREIVRRPFFAKILNQNFGSSAGDDTFQPQSEVDLIGNWWVRGGYNADGQDALQRQRAIVELGALHASHLERDIAVRDLSASTVTLVAQLVADGILHHVKPGHSLRFAHDIFFEWAFFHVLVDADDWRKEISACGEPPAMARVVELLSQSEFGQARDAWAKTLHGIDSSPMRSQWTRAWLLAPLASPSFKTSDATFARALEADDYRFLRKALVWFQAERTTPNPIVLERDLPQDERIRMADLWGWPSDVEMWSRFIVFLLARITTIPVVLYPDVVAIFEVWQNALESIQNHVSDALLNQVAAWLPELSKDGGAGRQSLVRSPWEPLGSGLDDFRQSLATLVFRSARVRPDLARHYLTRIIQSEDLRREKFQEVVVFSPILAESHPDLLVDFALRHLRKELPQARRERERRNFDRVAERRKRALETPPAHARRRPGHRGALPARGHALIRLPRLEQARDRRRP